jgi:hypothetical protein
LTADLDLAGLLEAFSLVGVFDRPLLAATAGDAGMISDSFERKESWKEAWTGEGMEIESKSVMNKTDARDIMQKETAGEGGEEEVKWRTIF